MPEWNTRPANHYLPRRMSDWRDAAEAAANALAGTTPTVRQPDAPAMHAQAGTTTATP